MAMERLAPDDAVMLWPDAQWPQEIGALAILDGASLIGHDGRLRIEAVRFVVESRLHLVPRFRQLLFVPRRGLGGPLWTDAPAFDVDQHLRIDALPAPGDDTTLLEAIERLRRERLDRSRPLWQICLFSGLPNNRVGLFVRMHHAIADGIAGLATIATFLDATPDRPTLPAPPPWTPRSAPTARQLWVDNLHCHAHEFGRVLTTFARDAGRGVGGGGVSGGGVGDGG
jgi:diacylglycerol O-acyltransferase / wax synthase